MTKKLAPKAKNKAPAKKPVAATKVVKIAKKVKAAKSAPAKSKTNKKVVKKPVKKSASASVAAKKPKPKIAKKASKPAAPIKAAKAAPKPALKIVPKPIAKPVAKPAAKTAVPVPATPPKVSAPAKVLAAPAKTSAPKAMASAAKHAPAVKVKRPPTPNGVEFAGSLSDDNIRAMSDEDYMNDVQLEFFRQRLIKMREEVLARELDVKERLHQREVFADPADRATAEEEHWLDLRLRERESMLMRKIEDALRRIRDKEYGYCVKTGEVIGIPRLLARPTATVIVDVKGQDEKVETHFRDR
ncbi:MAG: dksA [Nevskia sp.]|nr:dksA [Nevskia sp.]